MDSRMSGRLAGHLVFRALRASRVRRCNLLATIRGSLVSSSVRPLPSPMSTQSTKPQIVLREKARLMSASEIERTLVRLAHEIVEKNNGVERLGFVGIKRRGVPLAQRLAGLVTKIEKEPIDVGTLDINLYRDDLSTTGPKPIVNKMEIGFDVTDKNIILVDDVLYTGRTIRAALDALFDHGRPSRVQLLVLIDRGHRELPIEARFVGRTVQTADNEIIEVKFQEIDQTEKVLLVERVAAGTA